MSDERKKSRAWIWWVVMLLLMLYPLSLGPAAFVVGTGMLGDIASTVESFYLPLLAPIGDTGAGRALRAYADGCFHAGERFNHR